MKIYLAARYSRHPEMEGYANVLTDMGHTVTSRWIYGDHELRAAGQKDEERERLAIEDFEDLTKADVVLNFTEDPNVKLKAKPSKGGRHVEFGIALALNKQVVVIGPREHVFHWLPTIEVYDDLETFLDTLEV